MNQQQRIFWSEFLDLYKSLPSLWKVHSRDYTNRELKNKSYDIMVKKLKEYDAEADREKVIKKINVFRTNYKRVLRLQKTSDNVVESSLWYFDKLKYLDEVECIRGGPRRKQTDSTTEPKTKKHKVKEVTSDTPVQQSTIRPPSNNGFAAGANESYFPPNQHFTAIEMPQQPQKQQQQQQPPHSQQKQQHQEQQATSRTTDSCQQIAQIWGLKLAKMSRMQRIIAEKVINEVMFNGELGLLNLNTGLTHIGSRIDTDPISSIDAENEQEFITIENKNIFDL
ncbi:activating signal cointegrator 1 complex subunit 2 homolog isoform X2 [Lucilia sericata]|uniref:activating signal cointegrator 1 complex subunit 2 homolog isoform X2 n=1 Tax=Lucilia sericata TaxID=13632 RepID=UPI0018A8776F|nr:activating signal cointegrator 1 complex subunit 2 homolog isoform X2 [Lucilia sericata]